jgi:hypothetical protein
MKSHRRQVLDAFKTIRSADVRARANFMCCQTCGHGELSRAYPDKPYVFWHRQDERSFDAAGNIKDCLCLRYHLPTRESVMTVLNALNAQPDLVASWTWDLTKAIVVEARNTRPERVL